VTQLPGGQSLPSGGKSQEVLCGGVASRQASGDFELTTCREHAPQRHSPALVRPSTPVGAGNGI
jgi:hypothetical protein